MLNDHDIDLALKLIQIGDPLKTLFQPEYIIDPFADIIHLKVLVPNANNDGSRIAVTFREPFNRAWDKEFFVMFCFKMFERLLMHELKESFYVQGRHFRAPH